MKCSRLGGVVMMAGALFASACDDDSDSSDSMRAGSGSGAKSSAGGSAGSPVHAGGGAGESSAAHGGGGARGEGDDVCRTEAACGDDGIAFLDCPSQLSDLDLTCEQYITIDRYQGCGQVVLELSNGIQTSQYTFAADGELLGTYSAGDVGDHACFGEPCMDLGEREVVCDGIMGGGAGGDGGSGGAGGFAGAGGRP